MCQEREVLIKKKPTQCEAKAHEAWWTSTDFAGRMGGRKNTEFRVKETGILIPTLLVLPMPTNLVFQGFPISDYKYTVSIITWANSS